jgi:pimeloyl-ACP methyl ester carboxylesterase
MMLVALALTAAGCGGGGNESRSSPRPTALAAHETPPPGSRCGAPKAPAKSLWLQAADRTRLDGAVVGDGTIGVLFLHEYPGPSNGPFCGWWPYAAWLARHHVRSLLVNLRCFGESACPAGKHVADPTDDVRGGIATLERLGAERIVLVGASLGGVVAIKAAAEIRPPVAAVVDLSGELDLGNLLGGTSDLDAGSAARNVVSPALLAVARGDRYTSVPEMKAIYRRLGSKRKRLIIEPAGLGHGWDMLTGTSGGWSPLARQVLAFVRGAER